MRPETFQRRLYLSAVLLSVKEVRCGVTRNRIHRELRTRNRKIGKRISRQSALRRPTTAPGLYPKGKRETETNLDSRPRGQDLAESVEGFITDVQP
jgi:hypothetical protein